MTIRSGVETTVTNTHKRILLILSRVPTNPITHLTAFTISLHNTALQNPDVVLQSDAVFPPPGVRREVAERHNGSVRFTLHSLEVELVLGVKIRRRIDAASVGWRKRRKAERDDGGAGVEGGAEVGVSIADGRGDARTGDGGESGGGRAAGEEDEG